MNSEMNNEIDEQGGLRSKIEKIIISGTLTPDDQKDINIVAQTGNIGTEELTAMEILTEMVRQGKIYVSQ